MNEEKIRIKLPIEQNDFLDYIKSGKIDDLINLWKDYPCSFGGV